MSVAYRAVHHVHRAAIGALGRAVFGHIKVNLRVRVPLLHASQRRWAIDAALSVEVGGFEFDGAWSVHGFILQNDFHHRMCGERAVQLI